MTQISSAGRVNPPLNRAYTGGAFLYASLTGEYRASQHIAEWMNHQAAWPGLTGWNFSRSYNGRTLGEQWSALEVAERIRLRDNLRVLNQAGYAVGMPLLEAQRTSYHHPHWTVDDELVVMERSYSHPNRVVTLSKAPQYRKDVLAYTGATAHEGLTPFVEGVIASEIRRGMFVPESNASVLVLITRDGHTTDLAHGGLNGWAPAFHAGTMRLAYIASIETGGHALRMAELDSTGNVVGSIMQLVSTQLGHLSDPAWSTDGMTLAFTADLGDGEAVYVLDMTDLSLLKVRIDNAATTWDPAWSPDGSLWISSDRGGIYNLYEVSLADSSATQRTRVITGAMEPSVASDGERVAYAHYTAEGFNVALLDSSRWLDEPVAVSVETVGRDVFSTPDSLLAVDSSGTHSNYSPLPYMAPNYAMPSYGVGDELSFGATVYGQDPVSLLAWKLSAHLGIESILPEIAASLTYRELPVDIRLSPFANTEELLQLNLGIDSHGDSLYFYDTHWKHTSTTGLTVFQQIHLDRGKWRTTAVPYAVLVHRTQ